MFLQTWWTYSRIKTKTVETLLIETLACMNKCTKENTTQILSHLSKSWQNVGKQNVNKSYFQTTRHSLLCSPQFKLKRDPKANEDSWPRLHNHFAGEALLVHKQFWGISWLQQYTLPKLNNHTWTYCFTKQSQRQKVYNMYNEIPHETLPTLKMSALLKTIVLTVGTYSEGNLLVV